MHTVLNSIRTHGSQKCCADFLNEHGICELTTHLYTYDVTGQTKASASKVRYSLFL